jgi:hypothetical protein
MIRFADPRSSVLTSAGAYTLRLVDDHPVIGLISNAYQDCSRFLGYLGDEMQRLDAAVQIRHYVKPSPADHISKPLTDTIVAECHAVVAAFGH